MNSLTQEEKNRIDFLSEKIDNNTAIVNEYEEYEALLIKAGFSREQITAKLRRYGYYNYKDYYDARKDPKTKAERNIVEIVIVAGLVVLSVVIGSLIVTGRIILNKTK